MGKRLIDYVIESENEINLLSFFRSSFSENNKEQLFLVLKNEQYQLETKKTIFQKLYAIISDENIENQLKEDCMSIIKSYCWRWK